MTEIILGIALVLAGGAVAFVCAIIAAMIGCGHLTLSDRIELAAWIAASAAAAGVAIAGLVLAL